MTDAYIYDHVRSPRGRGKQGGSLNSITPMNLTSQVLQALRDRHKLDTSLVDDVIMGCVTPVGEQGANIARVAALMADYAESVPGNLRQVALRQGSAKFSMVPKGVRYRCRNGPQGASHNGT